MPSLVLVLHHSVLVPCDLASPRLTSHPVRVVGRVVSPTRQAKLAGNIDIAVRIPGTTLGNCLQLILVALPGRSAERACDGLAFFRRCPLTKAVLVNVVSTCRLAVNDGLGAFRFKVVAADGTFAFHGLAAAIFLIIAGRLRGKWWCSCKDVPELSGDECKLVLQFGRRTQHATQYVDDVLALVSLSCVRAVASRHFINGDGVNITCGAGQRNCLRRGFRVTFGALAVQYEHALCQRAFPDITVRARCMRTPSTQSLFAIFLRLRLGFLVVFATILLLFALDSVVVKRWLFGGSVYGPPSALRRFTRWWRIGSQVDYRLGRHVHGWSFTLPRRTCSCWYSR